MPKHKTAIWDCLQEEASGGNSLLVRYTVKLVRDTDEVMDMF